MEIVFNILVIVILIGGLYLLIRCNKIISLVRENSNKLIKLDELNKRYEFEKSVKKNITIIKYVKNKEELASINLDVVLNEEFLENTNNISVNYDLVAKNDKMYVKYLNEYNSITDVTSVDIIKITNLSEGLFKIFEHNLFKFGKKKPLVKTSVKIIAKYDGQSGENKYKQVKLFKYDYLNNLKKEI